MINHIQGEVIGHKLGIVLKTSFVLQEFKNLLPEQILPFELLK